ncbi:MAG: AbrB family transcriptional regulator [Paracoccaceae bacterium]|nr:AbrB family transcriptional regulator [Paracoccaceae bacterium]
MIGQVKTFVLAAVGVGVFTLLGLPLPFLFGPMTACLLAAFGGMKLRGFGQITVAARTILGIAVGASITPALFLALPDMAISILAIPVFIFLIGLVGVPFFRKVWKLDPVTAFYAAMPGGLQDMVIFGQEAGGDPRALSLIHATRVLIIVTLAPLLLVSLYGASLDNPIGAPASQVPVVELVLMFAAALIGWKGGERLGLFGASILGPMIVATILSLAGLIHARPPKEAILIAQFFIGTGIGAHFVGITFVEFKRTVMAGISYVFVLAVLAAGFSFLIAGLGVAAPLNVFLAYAPGGQAEMTVLAIVAGADLGFIICHHLVRIVLVIVGAPIVAKWLKRSKPQD